LDSSWKQRLSGEFTKPYFKELVEFVAIERKRGPVFPPPQDTFNCFKLPFDDVKVVILGQDPYHGAGQAHGLSFSVQPGTQLPPSLRNIFKELVEDLEIQKPKTGWLEPWCRQGVLLLNTTLTVRAHQAGSHQGQGWEQFTDEVIRTLSSREKPVIFVLWGRHARAKKDLIDSRHTIIESAHPSPMSASSGFFGSKPFSKVNAALQQIGEAPIDWAI